MGLDHNANKEAVKSKEQSFVLSHPLGTGSTDPLQRPVCDSRSRQIIGRKFSGRWIAPTLDSGAETRVGLQWATLAISGFARQVDSCTVTLDRSASIGAWVQLHATGFWLQA